MSAFEAFVTCLIADFAVLLSFLDSRIIDAKVRAELGPGGTRIALITELQSALALGATIDQSIRNRVADIVHKADIPLSPDLMHGIVNMCTGAATVLGWFANMMIILATAVAILLSVSQNLHKFALITLLVILLATMYHIAHINATVKLSYVDTQPVWERYEKLTLGTVLRIELLLLNVFVFIQLAFAVA